MPPHRRPRFVLAKNESSGASLLERIRISDPHRFDHVCKRRPAYKPRTTYTPVPGRRESLARSAELNDFKHQLQIQDYLNEQRNQKRSLASRIERTPTPPPLIERVDDTPALPIDVKPLPEGLNFRTFKQTNLLHVYGSKFEGAVKHLGPFFEKLNEPRFRVGLTEHELWILTSFEERFNNIRKHLTTIVETKEYTNREWKKITSDLSKAGKHRFASLKPRFVEHCRELIQELGEDWLLLQKN